MMPVVASLMRVKKGAKGGRAVVVEMGASG